MGKIIAGRFIEQATASAAQEKLVEAGFDRGKLAVFFLGSPGRHDLYPIGGDEGESPGAKSADAGAVTGAAGGGAIGAAAGALGGPAGAVMGAAVGAYVGSLPGALDRMKEKAGHGDATHPKSAARIREAGMLLAVSTPDAASETSAIQVLRAAGATDIERTDGAINDGNWVDFDPLSPQGVPVG